MKDIFLICFLVSIVNAGFDLQLIGDSVSKYEAEKKDLCGTKYCVLDSELLFTAATQNASVDPRVDFKEFALGNFIKFRALNDRYYSIGMRLKVRKSHDERFRKALASKITENEPRVFKVMKNFFKKCVTSSMFISSSF